MIKFFRKIRQRLLTENKFSKYLIYAIGEIILVVIGILIALQINNLNEAKKTRAKEVAYLTNIKSDLEVTNAEIDQYVASRAKRAMAASSVVEHYNGKPVTDWNEFNKHTIDVYTWQRFYQIDNTFQELMNSGNFAIISNDSIKSKLLTVDKLYKKLKYSEDHFRYDAEITLYEPSYEMTDIHSLSNNYFYQNSDGKNGFLGNLSEDDFREMLKDQKQKNGFVFAAMYFKGMNTMLLNIKEKNKNIISLIDSELKK
ncbi:DUF6090 family protein [Sabulilitoribacter multivorans]|uniref:DUF6090 family protein n=1 Tax=Flaviramulus multivorans TaxID=1304750 RepID=A0ABS9IGX4_9FLAO|nr:DUF6090 family protein [Flaviramulus multivorans]MCF7559432.1 DUF6090 family protein [Flaviramulus multivorans]